MLAGEFPLLRFRVIGEGPALESVARLAEDLGVADRVEFRGFVPNGQIPSLLRDATAGISPQRGGAFGSLVFSMKVAEYVFLGLPVICSGIATMRYYFSDDELLFFEPANAVDLARAIRALLADPAAARNGRQEPDEAGQIRLARAGTDACGDRRSADGLPETAFVAQGGTAQPLADPVRRMRTTEQKDKEITKHA